MRDRVATRKHRHGTVRWTTREHGRGSIGRRSCNRRALRVISLSIDRHTGLERRVEKWRSIAVLAWDYLAWRERNGWGRRTEVVIVSTSAIVVSRLVRIELGSRICECLPVTLDHGGWAGTPATMTMTMERCHVVILQNDGLTSEISCVKVIVVATAPATLRGRKINTQLLNFIKRTINIQGKT